MKFFEEKDALYVKNHIEKDVEKNQWSWKWPSLKVALNVKSGEKEFTVGEFVKKGEFGGKAWCTLCNCSINHENRGSIALIDHIKTVKHVKKVSTITETRSIQSMMGMGSSTSPASEVNAPVASTSTSESIREAVNQPVHIFDRVSNAEVNL